MDLSEVRHIVEAAIRAGLAPLRTRPPVSLLDWAEENFYLSAESSYVESRWHAYPFQRAMLHALGSDDVTEIDVKKSARVGYTKMICAAICYNAHHRRRNQGIWNPTDDDSDEFCKTELEPLLRDIPAMADVWTPEREKDRRNTLRTKLFRGSTLFLRGGKAAKNFRRLTLDVGYIDELEGFDPDIQKEGDAPSLVKTRLAGATWPKLVIGSTPKLKALSQIGARCASADVRYRYVVPCAHCGERHPLTWTATEEAGETRFGPHGMAWTNGDPETVAHRCPHCSALMTQAEYLRVAPLGVWLGDDGSELHADGTRTLADGTRARLLGHVAFHVWTAYAPLVRWPDIVREYQDAEARAKTGDTAQRKSFANLTLGEEYEDKGERTNAKALKARAEHYALRRVPRRALVLATGIDVQDDRFELVTWGFGPSDEMWTIDYTVLHADTSLLASYALLDGYLATRFPHEGGQHISIDAAAIDTQGHNTHTVYQWVAKPHPRKVFACKGHSVARKPIVASSNLVDINIEGQIQKDGVRLWMVGTDTAKDLLFARLTARTPGPGFAHLSAALPPEFFEHLAAEQRVKVKTAHGFAERWAKISTSARNEALDCSVLALFAAYRLDLHRYTAAMWSRLEKILCPPTRDMFTDTTSDEEVPAQRAEEASAKAGAEAPPAAEDPPAADIPATHAVAAERPTEHAPEALESAATAEADASSVAANLLAARALAKARATAAKPRPVHGRRGPGRWGGF